MDLIINVLWLSLIAAIVWIITTKVQMDPIIAWMIRIAAAIVIFLFLMKLLGAHVPNVMP